MYSYMYPCVQYVQCMVIQIGTTTKFRVSLVVTVERCATVLSRPTESSQAPSLLSWFLINLHGYSLQIQMHVSDRPWPLLRVCKQIHKIQSVYFLPEHKHTLHFISIPVLGGKLCNKVDNKNEGISTTPLPVSLHIACRFVRRLHSVQTNCTIPLAGVCGVSERDGACSVTVWVLYTAVPSSVTGARPQSQHP